MFTENRREQKRYMVFVFGFNIGRGVGLLTVLRHSRITPVLEVAVVTRRRRSFVMVVHVWLLSPCSRQG